MANQLPTGVQGSSITIHLDDELVEISSEGTRSLVAVRACLERIALRDGRVLSDFVVDGVNRALPTSAEEIKSFRAVHASTVSLNEFSYSVLSEIDARLADMAAAVERAALLVLINERWFACRCWHSWLGALRSLLARLHFVEELTATAEGRASETGRLLALHVEALHTIHALVGVILAEGRSSWTSNEGTAFSTLCEKYFLVWLQRLRGFLGQLRKA